MKKLVIKIFETTWFHGTGGTDVSGWTWEMYTRNMSGMETYLMCDPEDDPYATAEEAEEYARKLIQTIKGTYDTQIKVLKAVYE